MKRILILLAGVLCFGAGAPFLYATVPSSNSELIIESASVRILTPLDSTPALQVTKKNFVLEEVPEKYKNKLDIFYPPQRVLTPEHTLKIKGVNRLLTPVYINGKYIPLRQDGRFSMTVPLISSSNKITFWITFLTTENRALIVERKLILLNTPPNSSKYSPQLLQGYHAMTHLLNQPIQLNSLVTKTQWALFLHRLRPSTDMQPPLGTHCVKRIEWLVDLVHCLELNLNTPSGNIPFQDVSQDHWTYKFVKAAFEQGFLEVGSTLEPQKPLSMMELLCLADKISEFKHFKQEAFSFTSGFTLTDEQKKAWLQAPKDFMQQQEALSVYAAQKKLETTLTLATKKEIDSSKEHYRDIQDHWVIETAEKLKRAKVLDYGSSFLPEQKVTRSEAYRRLSALLSPNHPITPRYPKKIITRIDTLRLLFELNALGVSPNSQTMRWPFRDISRKNTLRPLLQKALDAGLISPDRAFHPNQGLTRAELASFIIRLHP